MGRPRWTTLGMLLAGGLITTVLTIGGCPPGTINIGLGSGNPNGQDDDDGPGGRDGDEREIEFERLDDCGTSSVEQLPQAGLFLKVEHDFAVNVTDSDSDGLEALLADPNCGPDGPRSEQREPREQQVLFEMGRRGIVAAIHNLFQGFDGRKLFATSPSTGGLHFVLYEGCLELISGQPRPDDDPEFGDEFDPNDPNDDLEFDPNDDFDFDFDPNDPNSDFEDNESPFGDPTEFFDSDDDSLVCGDDATELRGGDPNDPNNPAADVGLCVSIEVLGDCRECERTDLGWKEIYRIRVEWTALEGGELITPCGDEVTIAEGDTVTGELTFTTLYRIVDSPEEMGYSEADFGGPGGFDPNALGFDPNTFDPNTFDPNYFDPNLFDPNLFDPNSFDPNTFDPNIFDDFDPNGFLSDPNGLFSDPNDFAFDPNEFGF